MPSRESKIYPPTLTRRERSILSLIAEGYRNEEIADKLTMSERTIRGARENLLRKWNAPNVSIVIDRALQEGLISIYEVLESRFSKRN